jgi:hypothetical protein
MNPGRGCDDDDDDDDDDVIPAVAGIYFAKYTGKYDLQVIGSFREACAILLQLGNWWRDAWIRIVRMTVTG